jgi:putative ABC transport system substrate-binding protein
LRRHEIIDFLESNRIPAIFTDRDFVLAGGLMSYSASESDLFRRSATYVHKILRGSKPSDLPVEQPTKFDLVLNLKTAKTLGLTFPQTLLALADDVIE